MSRPNQLDCLPDMAVFARVVEAGSFSEAAHQLGLTPSAVSRQIARLEAVLRVQLLVRTTRKLNLTEAGSAAYTRCQDMVAAAREVLALSDTHTATPRDLAQHSCIYLGENEQDRHWRFGRAGEEVSVKVSGRYVAKHSEVRLDGALQSLGIASLPEFTAKASLASGALVPVLEDWQHLTHYAGTAWLLYPLNRFLAAKLRVWIDHLVAGLTGEPAPGANPAQ